MLVKLYALPGLDRALADARAHGVTVRRALVPEKPRVLVWMQASFPGWAAEVEAAFSREPVTCFLALRDAAPVGFACHDAICRNFFGPMAVIESERGRGVGRALLLAALHAQRAQGYAYAIIGGIGPAEFYARTVGAVTIEDSTPGLYAGMLADRKP